MIKFLYDITGLSPKCQLYGFDLGKEKKECVQANLTSTPTPIARGAIHLLTCMMLCLRRIVLSGIQYTRPERENESGAILLVPKRT